nr:putative ribonuclease H-like domain-containing protein [Tanacetum cinerariifolium]
MDQQYPTVAKIPTLDTGKFEQWQFRIQQYLQYEHYALWEVIEFGDSYEVPTSTASTTTTHTPSGEIGKESGRTVTMTAKDMQKKKNDVKARTALPLSLSDEHQLRFSKYKTARELWAAILKTFGGNETTKKTKKNLLKQQYGNFKAEAQKLWSRRLIDCKGDLDTMSLDDLYNHLKVYEFKVQKKSKPNSQKMAFISSGKHINGNKDGNTACVPTASTNVPTASTNVPTASASVATISQDTSCTYIASQSSDRVGWDWSYMANDEEDHALVADEVAPTKFALMANTNAKSKVFDNSLCSKDCKKNNDSLNGKITDLTDKLFDAKDMIYHYKLGLAQVESRLVEYKEREVKYCEKIRTLEFRTESNNECIEILKKKIETLKQEKEGVDRKLAGLLTASKDLDNLIESQRADKNKEGLGYIAVPPPPAQIYSSPKKDLTPSISETVASPITPKPFIKFVKSKDSQSKSKTDEIETPKKPQVKYAEQYRKPNKKPNVRGNQRNWNNLKSQKLGPDFVMKKKACFNCGDFNHLAYECRKRVKKSFTPKPIAHRPYRPPVRPVRTNMNGARPNITSFNKQAHSYANRPFHRTSAGRSHYRASWVLTVNRNFPPVNRKFSTGSRNFPTANRSFPTASRKFLTGSLKCFTADMGIKGKAGSSQNNIDDKGYWDSGCSRHMTCNISYLSDYEPFDGGYVSFGQGGCKITGKGTIKTDKLEFKNMYFVKDLKDLTCLVAKASADECMLWHRRLGIKREFSNARTPQQNGVVKRRNRTLIEAAKTILANAKLPVTFWAEVVNTACYVQNRVLVNKSHNKTSYELFNGRSPAI